jgi:hypothetical protein
MASITGATAVLTLAVTPLFPAPQQLQGFAADDVTDVPQIKSAEVLMGVDGKLSGGFVYVQVPQSIVLMADSPSNDLFDLWWTSMQASKDVFLASGIIILPAIAKKFNLVNGYLTGYKPAPQAKKLLLARQYEITWEAVNPAPT